MKKQKEAPFITAAFTIAAGLLIIVAVLLMNRLPNQIFHNSVSAVSNP